MVSGKPLPIVVDSQASHWVSVPFALFVVKFQTKEQQLHKEQLLDIDDGFHGAVAKRLGRAQPTPDATPDAAPAEAPMDSEHYPAYAMA